MIRNISLLCLLIVSLRAEKLEDVLAQDLFFATVNAAIVFTSQDGLSSGRYRFTDLDTEMTMYNLPLLFHFDKVSENSNFFMITDMGYSDTRHQTEVDDNTSLLHYANRLQTYVVGVGGGVRYRFNDYSNILFGAELLYSRIGISDREDRLVDDSTVGNIFSGDFSTNYSYKLLAEYEYHHIINQHKISMRLNYKLYQTLSELKFGKIVEDIVGDIGSLSSQTSVASLLFSYETSPLYSYHDMSFTLEPFLKGNYILGDLATVTKVTGYGTVGLSFYWNTPEQSYYIYRYFIEPSVSHGDGLEGLNLSLGFSLDF